MNIALCNFTVYTVCVFLSFVFWGLLYVIPTDVYYGTFLFKFYIEKYY